MPVSKRKGRPLGSRNRPREIAEGIADGAAHASLQDPKLRPLPEDPGELKETLAIPKIMVRPVIDGLSRMFEALEVSPLDSQEKDAGTMAGAMLAYQYGMLLDGRVAVILFALSILPMRIVEYVERRKEKAKATVAPALAPG